MFFTGKLVANFDVWRPALGTVSTLVWLHGRCQTPFDVLPLYKAHELSSGVGHHHACYTMLPHKGHNIASAVCGSGAAFAGLGCLLGRGRALGE
jgi:hypothetical protein